MSDPFEDPGYQEQWADLLDDFTFNVWPEMSRSGFESKELGFIALLLNRTTNMLGSILNERETN